MYFMSLFHSSQLILASGVYPHGTVICLGIKLSLFCFFVQRPTKILKIPSFLGVGGFLRGGSAVNQNAEVLKLFVIMHFLLLLWAYFTVAN